MRLITKKRYLTIFILFFIISSVCNATDITQLTDDPRAPFAKVRLELIEFDKTKPAKTDKINYQIWSLKRQIIVIGYSRSEMEKQLALGDKCKIKINGTKATIAQMQQYIDRLNSIQENISSRIEKLEVSKTK